MCGFQFGGTNGGKGWKVLYKGGIYLVKCRVAHSKITASTSFILFYFIFIFFISLLVKAIASLFVSVELCNVSHLIDFIALDACSVFEYKINPSTLILQKFGLVTGTFLTCTCYSLMTFCSLCQDSVRP